MENLAKACTKFLVTESKNDLVIKRLKFDFVVSSNFDKFYSPILNEEILENRNIHSHYKRNDRRWFDFGPPLSKTRENYARNFKFGM